VFKIAHIAVGLGQGGSVADLANWRDHPHMPFMDQSMQPTAPARRRPVVLPLATERACQMFTAEQYRAKAAEFRVFLTNTSRSPNETREFRDLEQTYTTLAENEEWMGRANFEVPGRGRAYALEYCSHEAPTGALRLRHYHRGPAANDATQGTDSSVPSQS